MSANIPGYLLWAALIYAGIGTTLTHWIGARLDRAQLPAATPTKPIPFQPGARAENSEQIAPACGESPSATACSFASQRGRQLMAIMSRQKKLPSSPPVMESCGRVSLRHG